MTNDTSHVANDYLNMAKDTLPNGDYQSKMIPFATNDVVPPSDNSALIPTVTSLKNGDDNSLRTIQEIAKGDAADFLPGIRTAQSRTIVLEGPKHCKKHTRKNQTQI